MVLSRLLYPAATLIGILKLGNLFRESLVVDRLSRTAQNELVNIVTMFLGLIVVTMGNSNVFSTTKILRIIGLGLVAFSRGTTARVLTGN